MSASTRGTGEDLEAGEFERAVGAVQGRGGGLTELAARACGELQGRECGVFRIGGRDTGEGCVHLAGDDGEIFVPGRHGQ